MCNYINFGLIIIFLAYSCNFCTNNNCDNCIIPYTDEPLKDYISMAMDK